MYRLERVDIYLLFVFQKMINGFRAGLARPFPLYGVHVHIYIYNLVRTSRAVSDWLRQSAKNFGFLYTYARIYIYIFNHTLFTRIEKHSRVTVEIRR